MILEQLISRKRERGGDTLLGRAGRRAAKVSGGDSVCGLECTVEAADVPEAGGVCDCGDAAAGESPFHLSWWMIASALLGALLLLILIRFILRRRRNPTNPTLTGRRALDYN